MVAAPFAEGQMPKIQTIVASNSDSQSGRASDLSRAHEYMNRALELLDRQGEDAAAAMLSHALALAGGSEPDLSRET